MLATSTGRNCLRSAYAGLDFIKAAFCPLEFTATKLKDHPQFKQLKKDEVLGQLEVGEALHYPRQYPYTDLQGNRKTGTQIVTAPFGLAPKDFDLLVGLYSYMKKLPEIPADGRLHLTVDFLSRQLGLPATCQKDYLRIRSRLFRFSYVKYTNTAFWNPETRTYDLVNFGFYNIAALSRLTESRRPITLEFDPTFLRIARAGRFLTFDYDFYTTLSPALRRLYLIANRDGWNQRDSGLYIADDFAIHQIGYGQAAELSRDRLHKLKRLFGQAENLDLVRPLAGSRGYFHPLTRGPRAGQLGLRWSRGPRLKVKSARSPRVHADALENDSLFAQVQEIRDEHREPVTAAVYSQLLAKFGRNSLQRHVTVILAQKESRPKSFNKSELAALINRLQHNHPEPDWYQALRRAERLSPLTKVQPNQLSLDLYGTFFRES
jgi:hypothetical protein